jgi:imidazolonepropionase-like amidohydrolase
MKIRNAGLGIKYLTITMILSQGISFSALAHEGEDHTTPTPAPKTPKPPSCQILTADRLFDGVDLHLNWAVLIKKEKIFAVGPQAQIKKAYCPKTKLGDATIMPGFIESHAHITFQNVRKDTVLKNGITTVQDTGGPLIAAEGGQGTLRLLSTGPIIQAPGGYPLNVFGDPGDTIDKYAKIGLPVSSEAEAAEVVQHLVDGGATAIKIALEPGGEAGAPWMMPHGATPAPAWTQANQWPMLSPEIVNAIVAKAHALGKRVIAHVGEDTGFERALDGDVDEFAHMPCSGISDKLLERAAVQGVTFVTTIDTLSSCVDVDKAKSPPEAKGIHSNTHKIAHTLAHMKEHNHNTGAQLIYGSEIGHDNVPWGINGEELHMIFHLTGDPNPDNDPNIIMKNVLNTFQAATSKAGERLGIPKLGTLTYDAPADIIAVKGNPFQKFKLLEYPDLVMSGGRVIVNNFKK